MEFDDLAARLREPQRKFVEKVMRRLIRADQEKATAEINFRALTKDGGVMDSYVEVTVREK